MAVKTKRWKRITGAGLALVMAFSVAGCGKDGATGASSDVMDKNHVFTYEKIELPAQLEDIRTVFYKNERIYAIGSNYEEGNKTYLCSMNVDGTDGKSVEIKTGYERPAQETEGGDVAIEPRTLDMPVAEEPAIEQPIVEEPAGETTDIWLNMYTMDEQGFLYGAGEVYRNFMDEEGVMQSESKQHLFCWSPEGELLWDKCLNDEFPDQEYFYIASVFCDADNLLWACIGGRILCAYNSDGEQVKKNEFPEEINGSFYMDKKGEMLVLGWAQEGNKQCIRKIDKNTLAIGPEEDAPDSLYHYGISMEGTVYDFLLSDSSAVYGYNLGDAEPVEIMNYIDSDIVENVYNICFIDDTHFVAVYSDPADWKPVLSLFTKVPPEEVKDKTPITLAAMYLDWNVRTRIIDFNKANPTYRIHVSEYQKYSTSEDYMAGYTQLNNDIIAGKIPDILLLDTQMPIDSYIAKGLLADLYPFMEKDPEIDKEDYLPNILEAFSVGGKLYELVPTFQVSTVLGKTSIVGDRDGWNLQEYQELMASMPEETQPYVEMTRDGMIYNGMMMTKDEYIDKETGECSFDSEGFVKFLEFANSFPEENDPELYENENYWSEMETACREDRAILTNTHLASYRDFNRAEKVTFGEDVTLIGFPTESKNGHAIIPGWGANFAISAKSKAQDGAWEFIRYYIMDEYQNNLQYQFPIKKTALEKQEKEATEKPYWMNEETGEKEYYDDTAWIGDVEIQIDPMTPEKAKAFTEYLSNLSLVGVYDTNIMNIIEEETAPYFEGQKSAQEVAKIIQSRAQLYISENR